MTDQPILALAARILRFDEWSHLWGADREERPGFVLFTARTDADPSANRAILGEVPAAATDATLAEIVRHFETRAATPRVLLTPLARPADWPERLIRAGFAETDEREVFLTLPAPAAIPVIPAVTVAPAATPADRDRVVAVQHAGFGGAPEHLAKTQCRTHEHLARRDQLWPLRYYLALLDGEPAGGATARLGEDLTGIYGVATLPNARRHGVATALLGRVLADARAAGHDLVFLAAQPGGYAEGYYRRLGFVPRFVTRTFERP